MLEAIDKFAEFWRGSGPREEMSPAARIRMIERADRLAFDFAAALGEENPTLARSSLRRADAVVFRRAVALHDPAHRRSGWLRSSDGVEVRHLPDAGHMLPLTHAAAINPEIVGHIALVDERAGRVSACRPASRGAGDPR